MTTKKPPRTRTAYQTAIVREIRAFCPPKPKKGGTPLTREQQTGFLLKPYETALMPDGTVAVIWLGFKVLDTKKKIVWLNYADIEKSRATNTAFAVFLDWCADRGLKYARVKNSDLPGAQFRFRYSPNMHQYHFRVTIPKQEPL